MKNKIDDIIKSSFSKYGKYHPLTIDVVQTLSFFFKSAEDLKESKEVLEQKLNVNIDELTSLLNPDQFDFQRQIIEDIGVEK